MHLQFVTVTYKQCIFMDYIFSSMHTTYVCVHTCFYIYYYVHFNTFLLFKIVSNYLPFSVR